MSANQSVFVYQTQSISQNSAPKLPLTTSQSYVMTNTTLGGDASLTNNVTGTIGSGSGSAGPSMA